MARPRTLAGTLARPRPGLRPRPAGQYWYMAVVLRYTSHSLSQVVAPRHTRYLLIGPLGSQFWLFMWGGVAMSRGWGGRGPPIPGEWPPGPPWLLELVA